MMSLETFPHSFSENWQFGNTFYFDPYGYFISWSYLVAPSNYWISKDLLNYIMMSTISLGHGVCIYLKHFSKKLFFYFIHFLLFNSLTYNSHNTCIINLF